MDWVEHVLRKGVEWPYDAPNGWTHGDGPIKPSKWSEDVARAILFDFMDRRGIKDGFRGIDAETRREIVETMSSIIERGRDGDI